MTPPCTGVTYAFRNGLWRWQVTHDGRYYRGWSGTLLDARKASQRALARARVAARW